MNKIGIYFAYWTKEWDADYAYYLHKVADLGFDVLEVATAHLLEMTQEELCLLKKAAEDRGVEITYCIGYPKEKDLASEDASVRRAGVEYSKKTLERIYQMGGKVFGGINYSAWPGIPQAGITDKSPIWREASNA